MRFIKNLLTDLCLECTRLPFAIRTLIGNACRKVADPNLIGKMSGHVDGSRAFKRYGNIEDETLKNVVDRL